MEKENDEYIELSEIEHQKPTNPATAKFKQDISTTAKKAMGYVKEKAPVVIEKINAYRAERKAKYEARAPERAARRERTLKAVGDFIHPSVDTRKKQIQGLKLQLEREKLNAQLRGLREKNQANAPPSLMQHLSGPQHSGLPGFGQVPMGGFGVPHGAFGDPFGPQRKVQRTHKKRKSRRR